MKFFWSALLLILISGEISEFSNLIVPSKNNFRIINYILLPTILVFFLKLGMKSIKLCFPQNFNKIFLFIMTPIIIAYLIELQQKLFLSLNIAQIQSIIIGGIALVLILYLSKLIIADQKNTRFWLKLILTPYIYLCIFIATTGLIAFVAIELEIIHLASWEVPNILTKNGFLSGRKEHVSMPFYVTLVHDNFFGGFNRYNGLSIEPHTNTQFCAPAIFFSAYFFNKNSRLKNASIIALITSYLILSFSITFYASLFACLALVFIKYFSLKKLIIITTSSSAFLLLKDFFFNTKEIQLLSFVLLDKIKGETGLNNSSSAHSDNILYYLNPDHLIGTGLFTDPMEMKWGLLSLFIYAFIVIFSVIIGLWLLLRKDEESIIGLGLIYYIIHSLKSPIASFSQPFLIYLYFIVALSLCCCSQKKYFIKKQLVL